MARASSGNMPGKAQVTRGWFSASPSTHRVERAHVGAECVRAPAPAEHRGEQRGAAGPRAARLHRAAPEQAARRGTQHQAAPRPRPRPHSCAAQARRAAAVHAGRGAGGAGGSGARGARRQEAAQEVAPRGWRRRGQWRRAALGRQGAVPAHAGGGGRSQVVAAAARGRRRAPQELPHLHAVRRVVAR